MAGVTLEKVNKLYENGFHAVQDLDLAIRDGEFLGSKAGGHAFEARLHAAVFLSGRRSAALLWWRSSVSFVARGRIRSLQGPRRSRFTGYRRGLERLWRSCDP